MGKNLRKQAGRNPGKRWKEVSRGDKQKSGPRRDSGALLFEVTQ